MYNFERIDINSINVSEYYDFPQKNVFTTLPWIDYLLEDNRNSEAVVLRITSTDEYIGYFTGVIVRKFGIRILGSPFPGWATSYMGFDLKGKVEVSCLMDDFREFCFESLRCSYVTVSDRTLDFSQCESKKYTVTKIGSLELSVDCTDEQLFKVFKTDCRNFIRQFERRGAILEVVNPDEKFVDDFYEQIIDVFDKQNLKPTWSKEKVAIMLKHLAPAGMVLCLRVVSPEGKCIATSIFPGYKKRFFFWAGASFREDQHYRPNEYMIWSAIKYWRDRGTESFDMVGIRDYKRKFGSHEFEYNMVEFAKFKLLVKAKYIASNLFYKSLKKG